MSTRAAFTLIEVLLTLAVLVILASFAWPVLDRLLESERLAKAADRVRARWTGARAVAIESGQLILFRYTPGANRYRIEYQQELTSGDEDKPACLARLPLEQTLPDGVHFAEDQGPGEPSPEGLDEFSMGAASDPEWSSPILFCPDGTCSNAQLELRNDQQWTVRLTLRGMTGVVTVGRPQKSSSDDLPEPAPAPEETRP
jgi:prepilin-type N-terminal cleavage/methylation domain-containing protein